MDAETIKVIVISVIGAITTIALAYIAARWNKTGKK